MIGFRSVLIILVELVCLSIVRLLIRFLSMYGRMAMLMLRRGLSSFVKDARYVWRIGMLSGSVGNVGPSARETSAMHVPLSMLTQ